MIFIPETGQLQSQIKRRDRARLMPSNYWLRTFSMLRLRTIRIGDRTIRRKKKNLKNRSLVEVLNKTNLNLDQNLNNSSQRADLKILFDCKIMLHQKN